MKTLLLAIALSLMTIGPAQARQPLPAGIKHRQVVPPLTPEQKMKAELRKFAVAKRPGRGNRTTTGTPLSEMLAEQQAETKPAAQPAAPVRKQKDHMGGYIATPEWNPTVAKHTQRPKNKKLKATRARNAAAIRMN